MISTLYEAGEETANLDWSRVRRVLLVRLRSIGDTVLMTPCLEAIKALRGDIAITVVSEPLAAPILEDQPLLDQLLVAPATLKARAKLIKTLRRCHFDLAFNLHGGTTASIIAALSGARQTIGYAGYKHSWMLDKRAPAPDRLLQRGRVHSVEQQLALLGWAGVPWPAVRPRLHLQVDDTFKQAMRQRLQSGGLMRAVDQNQEGQTGFAVLAPAAAFEAKRWPVAGFARVVDHVSERWNLPSVIIAGRAQEEVAGKVAALSEAKPRVFTGLSLKELMALISLSSLYVGNDSGPMHIAAALQRPLVGIFGASNPDVWHPWTEAPSRVVAGQDGAAIRKIAAPAVIAAVDEVMQEAAVSDSTALAS